MATDPLRVAIVGSGPAGFYAAQHLLKAGAQVDMFERLPTPWGLVRLGVAPDHPNIKAVSRVFEKVAEQPGFRFFGNVEIGTHLSAGDLRAHYHAVVWAVGAPADRRMGIPGEDLPGSVSATAFVAWYNGHPDYADLAIDLDVERIVVVGNGNVALDCARMLGLTRAELERTDTADAAIEAIVSSRVREIVVLGRRGPLEAAYTSPELAELGEMAGADVVVDAAEAAVAVPDDATHMQRRSVEIVKEYATRAPSGPPRTVRLRFLASPLELRGDGRVQEIVVGLNRLEPGADGSMRAVATGETEVIECGLVLRSVGYRGTPLEGVPFDPERAIIPNDGGRVAPGEYCSGWIKRGPSGVIGTNKKDANESAQQLLEDAAAKLLPEPADASPATIAGLVAERQPHAVEYDGWLRIDGHERDRGQPHERPRIKLCTWDELMALGRAPVS